LKYIGYLGSTLALLCSVPQVMLAFSQGHTKGLSQTMLCLWFSAMILLAFYVYNTSKDKALLAQYSITSIQVAILLYFSFFGLGV